MSTVANSPSNSFVSALPRAFPRVAPRLDRYSLTGWTTLALALIAAIIWATENGDTSSLVRAMNFILPTYFLTIMPYIAYPNVGRAAHVPIRQRREDGPTTRKRSTNY